LADLQCKTKEQSVKRQRSFREKATINFYQAQGLKIPSRGYLAANTVPGAISGWGETYKYAKQSMNLPCQLLGSAIKYAETGFPVTPSQETWTGRKTLMKGQRISLLQRFKGFHQTYLKSNGEPYQVS